MAEEGGSDAGNSAPADGERAATNVEGSPFTRRSLLQAAGVLGLAGLGTEAASADPSGYVGSEENPVRALYTEKLGGGLTGGRTLAGLTGTGLEISKGMLSAAAAAGDHVDVTADGETVAEDAAELAAGKALSASATDGAVTLDATLPAVRDSSETVLDDVLELNFHDNLTAFESGDGTVTVGAEFSDSNSQTDVSDSGTTVVSSTGDIDFGANLSASDDGDGTATVDADIHRGDTVGRRRQQSARDGLGVLWYRRG
jgi:hypothetical protein